MKFIFNIIVKYFIKYPHHIKYIKPQSLEFQLAIVNNNNRNIQYITNPYLETQLRSVNDNIWNIEFIKNPYLEVQLMVINRNGYCIILIKDPGYEVQLSAIQNNLNINKNYFKFIKSYITYPDLLELIELKILACEE